MLTHTTATTTVHDRIVEVVRRLGGDTNVCRTTIEVIPASEPNRLADALAAIVPARAILTGTLKGVCSSPSITVLSVGRSRTSPASPTAPERGHPGQPPPSSSTTPRVGSAPPTSAQTAFTG
jgi:hypothetical protein